MLLRRLREDRAFREPSPSRRADRASGLRGAAVLHRRAPRSRPPRAQRQVRKRRASCFSAPRRASTSAGSPRRSPTTRRPTRPSHCPAFLFNIAQCYRNMQSYERARFFFRRYLALDPHTDQPPPGRGPDRRDDPRAGQEREERESRASRQERRPTAAPVALAAPRRRCRHRPRRRHRRPASVPALALDRHAPQPARVASGLQALVVLDRRRRGHRRRRRRRDLRSRAGKPAGIARDTIDAAAAEAAPYFRA